ncbi:MAG: glycosyltransferase 61 family protein [Bacteroidales bacterium]|nr:glycosyltransferase 61 family protein [Bacteroidales bacterium]
MTYNFNYIFPQMGEETLKQASVHRRIDKTLGCQCFENAYVLPSKDLWKDGKCFGGVVTQENAFVESSAWHEGKRCDKYDFDPAQAKHESSVAIYMGFYFSCWGHAITDNLKKLWFLETNECKSLIKQGAKLIYLTTNNSPQPAYVKRLFQLAGVNLDDFILVTEITRFDKIFVPDNSFIADEGQRFFTQPYIETINRIKWNVSAMLSGTETLPSKIYFTRTHIKSLRDWGEKSIERAFQKKGYTVIAPEEETVEAQIAFMMHCTHFATTEGSISHNVVFCEPGVEIAIVRKCNDVNKYQMAVNEVADVNVTYIDAHHSTKTPEKSPWVGPFYLCKNRNLAAYLHLSCFIPYWLQPSWWIYNIQDTRLFKRIHNRLKLM